MKKRFQKMLTGIFLLALLVLMPVFSAYAEEYAKNVESANGRSAIVQKVSGTTEPRKLSGIIRHSPRPKVSGWQRGIR